VWVIRPKAGIRRFDVFAEYTRLEKLQEGLPADQAKGYGIWLAKVVAARKFGRIKPHKGKAVHAGPEETAEPTARFRSLSGVEQTDDVFDHDIIRRMGERFYEDVFAPTIQDAFRQGKTYKQIRDSIRKPWRP
jgi:hypothetical protein